MKYSRVQMDALGYELAPVVVTSDELEERLAPAYEKLRVSPGQLEALTGITERRWWEHGFSLSKGAALAAQKTLDAAGVSPRDVGVLIYAGVNRENFEPATACHVAAEVGISPSATIYDVSNACLGVLNGILDVANRIELGQLRAGLVVSCETAREINDTMADYLNANATMDVFTKTLATFTGGSGACAVLLTDGSFNRERPRLLGGVSEAAPEHHGLCRWGLLSEPEHGLRPHMSTDAVSVLKYGVELGLRTWRGFLAELGWSGADIDKVICHQVGSANRTNILRTLEISEEKDFSTFEYLGNIGTVSLPLTAALAQERGFLERGDRVAFLGIGSGLNCMMLGFEW